MLYPIGSFYVVASMQEMIVLGDGSSEGNKSQQGFYEQIVA
jgi:hypothetical protein